MFGVSESDKAAVRSKLAIDDADAPIVGEISCKNALGMTTGTTAAVQVAIYMPPQPVTVVMLPAIVISGPPFEQPKELD